MCQSKADGGKRCEYSALKRKEHLKLEKTREWINGDSFKRKSLEKDFQKNFQKNNRELFKNHLKSRESWQCDAKALPPEVIKELQKKFFRKPTMLTDEEAQNLNREMFEEFSDLGEKLSKEELNTLHKYTFIGNERLNNFLRKNLKKLKTDYFEYRDPSPEEWESTLKRSQEEIELMDSVFKKKDENKNFKKRTLYRHHIVPAGITPKEFAEKYFKIGERISDPAFLSTTEDPSYIAGHAHNRKPTEYIVYQIISSNGISMVTGPDEREGNVQSWEKERLLNRGTKLRVLGITRNKFGVNPERVVMRKQFGKGYSYPETIKDKFFTVVQLIDEEDIPKYLK